MLVVCQPKDGGPADLDAAIWQMNKTWLSPDIDTWPGRNYISMYSYWQDVSLGHINSAGSKIADKVYTLTYTKSQMQQISVAQGNNARGTFWDDCVSKANADIDFSRSDVRQPPYYGIIAMINVLAPTWPATGWIDDTFANFRPVPSGGKTRGTTSYAAITFNRTAWNNLTVYAHETGHGHGFDHSFNDYLRGGRGGGCPEEYGDPLDIMSALNVWSFFTTLGGIGAFQSGPGINAANLVMAGWLTGADVHVYNPTSDAGKPIQIAGLEDYQRTKHLPYAVKIPVETTDANHYLTVELRETVGWDQGLKTQPSGTPLGSAILVHEVTKTPFYPDACPYAGKYLSYLRTDGIGNAPLYRRDIRPYKDSVTGTSIRIAVNRIGCGTADITINPTYSVVSWEPPLAAPSGFTATAAGCGGTVSLNAIGNSPNPSDCTRLVPYVVFQRQDSPGTWTDLTYLSTGPNPGMGDAPAGVVATYRACNRNVDGDKCTAPVTVSVSHGACIPGDGKPKCGPGGPKCPTTH
jgi:hypothetical protein